MKLFLLFKLFVSKFISLCSLYYGSKHGFLHLWGHRSHDSGTSHYAHLWTLLCWKLTQLSMYLLCIFHVHSMIQSYLCHAKLYKNNKSPNNNSKKPTTKPKQNKIKKGSRAIAWFCVCLSPQKDRNLFGEGFLCTCVPSLTPENALKLFRRQVLQIYVVILPFLLPTTCSWHKNLYLSLAIDHNLIGSI